MKTKVRTFIHLTDSKGWEKEFEWLSQEPPPHTYRVRRKLTFKEIRIVESNEQPTDFPRLTENVDFARKSEKINKLNDNFYDLIVSYVEGW